MILTTDETLDELRRAPTKTYTNGSLAQTDDIVTGARHHVTEDTINCSASFDLGRIMHAKSSGYLPAHTGSIIITRTARRNAI